MYRKQIAVLAAAIVLVLAIGAVAVGDTVPTLTASKTALVYPHSAYLVASVSTPSVILQRLAGASDWTTFTGIPSGDTTVGVYSPKSTIAYKVVSDGVESDAVTITVAAQLVRPQVNSHGHRGHKMTVKGWIRPLHVSGTVQLSFYRWERTGTTTVTRGKKTRTVAKYGWVKHGDSVDVAVARQNADKSKWSYKWKPSATGRWMIIVSHEDVAHVRSAVSARVMIRR